MGRLVPRQGELEVDQKDTADLGGSSRDQMGAETDFDDPRFSDEELNVPVLFSPPRDLQDHPLHRVEESDNSSSSEESSDSSSSGSEVENVAAVAFAKKRPPRVFPTGSFDQYMCITSKLLHLKSSDVQGDKLRCGRRVSSNFELIKGDRAALLLSCAQCFP